MQSCATCGENDFVEDHARGDVICQKCGSVLPERIFSEEGEWRTFSTDDGTNDRVRTERTSNLLSETATFIDSKSGEKGRSRTAMNAKDKKILEAGRFLSDKDPHMTDVTKQRALEQFKQVLDADVKGQNTEVSHSILLYRPPFVHAHLSHHLPQPHHSFHRSWLLLVSSSPTARRACPARLRKSVKL